MTKRGVDIVSTPLFHQIFTCLSISKFSITYEQELSLHIPISS